MKQASATIKEQALSQAGQLGIDHGKTDFNQTGMVSIVDVVSECSLVGDWLDTLTSDPHAFNEAHAEIWNAYSARYQEALNLKSRQAEMHQTFKAKDFAKLNSFFGSGE